jgi:hypothetical protein
VGNFLIGIGIVVGSRSWWVMGFFIAYFAIFYPLIIQRERERMKLLFPEQYEEYGRKVPLFFPSIKRRLPAQGRFSWTRYKQNREYRALLGTGTFWLVLAAKLLLLNR